MALIRLNNACNQKCQFCNFSEEVKPLNLAELKNQLTAIFNTGDREIVFSGGEPTIYSEILPAIALAKEMGFALIELQTNGMLLAKEEIVSQFKQAGLNSVFIGLHAAEAKIYDELTGVPGGFELVIQAIKNLLQAKIKVRINIVINQKNFQQLLDLTRYIYKNFPGIESIDYSFIVSQGKAYANSNLVPKISTVVPHLITAYKYCLQNKIKFYNPICGIPVCFIPAFKDNSTEYLNLQRGGHSEFSQKNLNNKIKLAKCQSCLDTDYCTGIWRGYIELKGDNEFKV